MVISITHTKQITPVVAVKCKANAVQNKKLQHICHEIFKITIQTHLKHIQYHT